MIGWHENTGYDYLYNKVLNWYVYNIAYSGYPDAYTYAYRNSNVWGATDRAEISLARGFDWVQRYWLNVHGRHSFNDANVYACANAHEDIDYVNAFWDGVDFHFGDGDGFEADSLAVLDVAGHEFAHAVTEYSASLVYAYEPGALNESFSDIFGACVEFYSQADGRAAYPTNPPGTADWLCGEDCWLSSIALRDMRNPENTATVGAGNEQPSRYQGTYWYSGEWDNGGVHYNSGVQNFFFYLLSEGGSGNNDGIVYSVTSIGWTNAARIAYRALTVYCTPNTDFRAARTAWISAAQDLNPAWSVSVRAAWDAVGVHALFITPASDASFSGSEGGSFSPSTFIYTVTNTDSSTYGWGVSHTQLWVTVAPSGGHLSAFSAQMVTVSVNSVGASLNQGTHYDALIFTNSSSSALESRTVSLLVLPPTVYAFDLNVNPGWSVEGEWAFGQPAGLGGDAHGFSDPTGGATGANVFGVNLNGDYSIELGGPYYLTAGPLNFSGHTNVIMIFQRWLNSDYPPYVNATVEVSTDGATWNRIWTNSYGVEIAENQWSQIVQSVSAYADGQPTFYVRWGYQIAASNAYAYSSWNLDDIRFFGQPMDDVRVTPTDGLNVVGYEGGSFSPSNKVYTLTNLSGSNLPWTASCPSNWVSVTPSSGVLVGRATTDVMVAINTNANGLEVGAYNNATVTFSNTNSRMAQTRAVNLTVRGEIAFDSASYTVGEASGTALITVRRAGNTNRSVTVDFATSNGTATAGNDYAATNGTLVFAAGDTLRSFTVPILNDSLTEGDESVILTLSHPTGGGTLGDLCVATLTITDDDGFFDDFRAGYRSAAVVGFWGYGWQYRAGH